MTSVPTSGHPSAPVRARSFRDPAGYLVQAEGRLVRVVRSAAWPELVEHLESKTVREMIEAGDLVRTSVLAADDARRMLEGAADGHADLDDVGGFVEHERIPFPSFPYEWPAEMLHAAGVLTLDLAERLLPEQAGLKDATPYNVLFRGPRPVFVDVLSIERRNPGDPTWLPYAQSVRTFVLPLLAHTTFGLPLGALLMARRDGLEPGDLYAMCGPLRRLLPPLFGLVTAPVWLSRWRRLDDRSLYTARSWPDADRARFVLRHLFRRLRRQLDRVAPVANRESHWSAYMTGLNTYATAAMQEKEAFVRAALTATRPRAVLDVGANTGHFSAIAARAGASVVAVDSDPVVVGTIWRRAREERLDVLPLVVDVTRPTPATGWRNQECAAFLDRARGRFDCVLMLAVVHHMLVTERVPLPDIIGLVPELTRDAAVIEFVDPEDNMFRVLTRGRDALFAGLTHQQFEEACRPHFEIVRSHRLQDTSRWLYLLRRRVPADPPSAR